MVKLNCRRTKTSTNKQHPIYRLGASTAETYGLNVDEL